MSDWEIYTQDDRKPQKVQSEWSVAQQSPKEESFLKKLPRNLGIGLVHAGRDLHNLPSNIASLADLLSSNVDPLSMFLFANEKNKINRDINTNLADYFPYDERNYGDIFGQEGLGTKGDNMVQNGVQLASPAFSLFNALRAMKILPHLTRYGASKSLRKANKLASQRNIAPLDINPALIEDAAQFLPKTSPYKNALEGASYGDYPSIFKVQSDLGKHSSDYARSLFSASERAHGRAGLNTRKEILTDLHKGLEKQGHNDISYLFKKGQEDYARYSKFKPYRNALAVAAGAYALPKNSLIDLVKKLSSVKKD